MQPTLTPQEIQRAKELKAEGRTPEQIMGYLAGKRVNAPSTISVLKKENEFAPKQQGVLSRVVSDIPQDIASGVGNLGRDFQQRFSNMQDTAKATLAGEQGVGETALQLGGQIAGGLGDTAFRAIQTAGSLPLTQEAEEGIERAVGTAVSAVDQATGLSDWYATLDPKTQRNVAGALGFGELATIGVGKAATGGVLDMFKRKPRAEQLALPDPAKQLETVVSEAERGNVAPANRVVNSTLDEATRTQVVDKFTEALRSSLVENRMSINNNLEDLAKSASRKDSPVKRDDLLRNLAQEGYVPEIEGRLAKFDSSFADVARRQSEVMERLDEVLETSRVTVKTDDLYKMAQQALLDNPQIVGGLVRSQAELDRLFSSYRQKFGDELTAKQVNEIRKESNELTRAFRDSDKFSADTASELGKMTRSWLDDNVPSETVRQANAEWARLNNLDETMRILNNQQVDVGLLGRALGSYVTTVAGATAGVAVGGPGGLVIAGLLAKIGGDKMADLIRQRIFNPETATKVREIMQKDRSLLEKLEETTTNQTNKNLLNDFAGFNIGERLELPPAKAGSPRSEITGGQTIPVGGMTPAGRVETGITERTREGAVRRSDSEPVPTEIERAIAKDREAVEQAFSEIDAELSGSVRTAFGDNLVQSADGGYYRFNELPSWIPKDLRKGDLLARVLHNINEGRAPRTNASQEMELQELVQARINARVSEIKDTPDTKGVFSADTAFAVALMAGGTYYMMSEDGSFLPVVAGMAIASNPLARGAAAQQIRSHITMLKKDIATMEATGKQGTAAYKQKVKAHDAAMAEKQKIEKGESFKQGSTPQTTSLIEEARKYKSAER